MQANQPKLQDSTVREPTTFPSKGPSAPESVKPVFLSDRKRSVSQRE
jgi:hypothetical protein